MKNLDSIKKQRHHCTDRGLYSQSPGFSSSHVWMWELDHKEGWVPNNWWFELWCWRKLLRVPWASRRSNQSILKEISPEYSLEGLMLMLKLQSFRHLMWRADSLEKTLMPGKTEQEEKGATKDTMVGWHPWLNGLEFEQTQGDSEGQGSLACCSSLGPRELDTSWQMNNNNQAIPLQAHTQETQKHLHLFFFFNLTNHFLTSFPVFCNLSNTILQHLHVFFFYKECSQLLQVCIVSYLLKFPGADKSSEK